ncbi:MAG: c-type cytochrome, partial [Gemmatimonadetes bacterium]|nr:c-type cytochrome [Gemmatimonadota bacterium]
HRTTRRGVPISGMPAFDQLTDAQVNSLVEVLDGLWSNRPEPGAPIEVPPPPPTATPARGAQTDAALCAMCHGERGHGDGIAASSIRDAEGHPVRPANLASGRLKAGSEPEQIYLRIAAGIPAGGGAYLMPSFRAALSPEEIWSVVRYVETEFLGRR